MSPPVFALVFLSAFLHAAWNFAARRASGNLGAIWIGACLATVVCAPFALAAVLLGAPLTGAFPYIAATGALQALYFGVLAKAYEAGEISTVYPVARGSGVAGVALASRALLKESISGRGGLGIACICVGIAALGLSRSRHPAHGRAAALALAVGGIMVAYSIIDKLAVMRYSPVVYIFGMFAVSALLLWPYVWATRRRQCQDAWRELKLLSAFIGLSAMGTYLLVLFAFRLGPLSYVAATREFAVVIGAVLGIVFLKESLTRAKAAGIAAIALGLVLIKLA